MFSYDFHEKRGKDEVVYGPSIAFRVLCSVLCIPLAVGLYTTISEGTLDLPSLLPIISLIILILTVLYQDSYTFSNEEKRVTYKFGVGPFVKKEVINYSDIERIEVTHFVKGIPDGVSSIKPSWRHRPQVVLSIRIDADNKKDLEIMSERKSAGKLERNASWLSGFTGLALYVDRGRIIKHK